MKINNMQLYDLPDLGGYPCAALHWQRRMPVSVWEHLTYC